MPPSTPPVFLPTISLTPLTQPTPPPTSLTSLSTALSTALSKPGFAYLTHVPLSLTHTEILSLAQELFSLPHETKMSVAKKNFRRENVNTYRGYFPVQRGWEDYKEGFEIGVADNATGQRAAGDADGYWNGGVVLEEGNVWPVGFDAARGKLETLHAELQSLSGKLLSLLATALGRAEGVFDGWMENSLSTLRLLHYPASQQQYQQGQLSCIPHTDSGLLTLLFQDATGGLEILSTNGERETWVPVPYVEGSIVVNVGDLMERVSGGRWKATVHRVKRVNGEKWSVPFFFEPGRECWVGSVVDEEKRAEREGVQYGWHVLGKMRGWVEFGDGQEEEAVRKGKEVAVEA